MLPLELQLGGRIYEGFRLWGDLQYNVLSIVEFRELSKDIEVKDVARDLQENLTEEKH
jgi:hypothetical protein